MHVGAATWAALRAPAYGFDSRGTAENAEATRKPSQPFGVIPAEAGIQGNRNGTRSWIPAFAGMTSS